MTDRQRLEGEVLQVAAVAVAWVQAMRTGSTSVVGEGRAEIHAILADVLDERDHQQDLHGDQGGADDLTWLAILAEEVGEAAAEVPAPEKGGPELALRQHARRLEFLARDVIA